MAETIAKLQLPPIEAATVRSVRDALIEMTKELIEAGYEPAVLARALVATGANLANDMAGIEYALAELQFIGEQFRITVAVDSAGPATIASPAAGRA